VATPRFVVFIHRLAMDIKFVQTVVNSCNGEYPHNGIKFNYLTMTTKNKAQTPALFGLKNSNRDFSLPMNWGKNQFNNAFPAALACYMEQRGLKPVYLTLDKKLEVKHSKIDVKDVFGISALSPNAFYAFESIYTPFEIVAADSLPRIDLVVSRIEKGKAIPLRPLEIKLTALPDNQTAGLPADEYGCEIVVRPDTIVYLAFQIALKFAGQREALLRQLEPFAKKITDWKDVDRVLPLVHPACDVLDAVISRKLDNQEPLMLQPVWKTEGKKPLLQENCLDIFVWSELAATRLFVDVARNNGSATMTRHMRSVIWLTKMLYDFAKKGKINHKTVIDSLTYDTRNDKAFAVGGTVTRGYLKSPELLKPRIKKTEVKNIILGGGEKMLSPERRFDAAVLGTPGLF
jgi:hypothetical protein